MTHSHCSYCKTVRKIAFWGELPTAGWKRPGLLFCSIALAAGFGSLMWLLKDRPNYSLFFLLALPLTLGGVLGILVSVRGCDRCVAKLFGNV